MSIAYVVNGELKDPDFIKPRILAHDKIIAVDGGYNSCCKMGITPSLVIGDLDSSTPINVPVERYPKDKDKTDLQLSLEKHGGEVMTLYCATGGLLDHTLVHMLLLKKYLGRLVIDGREQVFALDKPTSIPTIKRQRISLIPLFGVVKNLTVKGLKWELNRGHLDESFTGISNQALGKTFEITSISGILIVTMHQVP